MQIPVAERANHLLTSGAVADAVALLEAAARRGNVDASMQLAVWYLTDQTIPRDLQKARETLRRTVALGHVDAALMEIALTANGSGAAPDWFGALSLLRRATHNDPMAADQLSLLESMDLDPHGAPNGVHRPEILSDRPDVKRFSKLLTPAECAHLAQVASTMLEPARVIDPRTGQWIAHPIRTSDAAAIGPAREDLVVRALNRRIAAVSGTDIDQGEPLTILRYRPGQQYRLHLDAIQEAENQRMATALVYLNEGYGGGETHFPAAGLTVTPRGGDVILFANTAADGKVDPLSRHAGLPVTQGVKWLATRWIRVRPIDPWTIS